MLIRGPVNFQHRVFWTPDKVLVQWVDMPGISDKERGLFGGDTPPCL